MATTIPGPSIINDPEKLLEFVNNLEDDIENFKTAVNQNIVYRKVWGA